MTENILVFDLETGGLNAKKCGVCSITFKVYGKDIIKTWYIKPNPDLRYDSIAMKVNGLSLEKLEADGQTETDVVKEVYNFIEKNYEIKPNGLGHNVHFDLRFMEELFERNTTVSFEDLLHYHKLDTMVIARFLKNNGKIHTEPLIIKIFKPAQIC